MKVKHLMIKLMAYPCDIKYKAGKEMTPPDYLSRLAGKSKTQICTLLNEHPDNMAWETMDMEEEPEELATKIDFIDSSTPIDDLELSSEQVAEMQRNDSDLKDLYSKMVNKANTPHKNLKLISSGHVDIKDVFVVNGVLYHRGHGHLRLMLPRILIPQVLHLAHSSKVRGHRGFDKTVERIKWSYAWRTLNSDVRSFIKTCDTCQLNQQQNASASRTPLLPIEPASRFNERVHMDLIGPLKGESDSKYILVITDAFTKYVHLAALKDKKAQTVAKAFFDNWISTFTAPTFLVTDNGKEFDNEVITELSSLYDIKRIKTTAYHPQSNSQCERFNRTLLSYLRNFVSRETTDWESLLRSAQLSYNTQIHRSTRHTPHCMVFLQDPSPCHSPRYRNPIQSTARTPGPPNPSSGYKNFGNRPPRT
jgi:transposase InsO family protein